MLSRLPKADTFIMAVDTLNEKIVSVDNLSSLIKNWPSDEFEGLVDEASSMGPMTKWEKTEAFFIKLGTKKKFETRIKLWLFKLQFDQILKDILSQQNTILDGFKQIKNNERFMKILGSILKVGNCMNAGNKTRGQADGYQLDALSKTLSIKDINGQSILAMILKKLHEEDESFVEFKQDFEACYVSLKNPVDDLKKSCDKA